MSQRKSASAPLSNLRVVRATVLGVRECLRDALDLADKHKIGENGAPAEVASDLYECLVDGMTFVSRGEKILSEASSRIAGALVAAGVEVRNVRGGNRQRLRTRTGRSRRAKSPATP